MSRHRNMHNLDEDDYGYDDDYYYDDDDDEYYLEQQREKERKQKAAAAKKARQNQVKQHIAKAAQTKPTSKKSSGGGISIDTGSNDKATPKKKGSGGISVDTISKKKGNVSFSVAKPPPGLSVEPANKKLSTVSESNNSTSNKQTPIPQIPPKVLTALRSLTSGGKKSNNTNNSSSIRSHLSLVILGHVDAGKSTLTGRLMLALNHVTHRQLQKYQKASTAIGKSSFALAWFTDEDESERERGVTIDIATKFVKTNKYDITILDAPGHKDFIPNMISGTASADCGLLVIAATTGEFEAGFAKGGGGNGSASDRTCGQTREHIVLSRGLGVTQFVVAVNKLDAADPAWSKERFEYIQSLVLDYLKENGFKDARIKFVPVSGLNGVNVSKEGKIEDEEGWKALRKWYTGPTLVEALDSFVPAKREFEKPLRVIVTDVSSEGKNVTVRGRVVQGFVRMGDEVVVLPVGDEASVVRVERGKATKEGASPYSFATTPIKSEGNNEKDIDDIPELQNCALAGDIVELSLSGIDPARISTGCVICHPHLTLRPKVKRKFEARVMVMERLAVPIIRGSQVLLHMHSIDVPAVLSKLVSSERRGDAKPRQNPRVLTGGMTATVEITLSEKIVIEASNECKSLGRFVLRRGGDTIAVGLIDKVIG